jgi:hypothetical protein
MIAINPPALKPYIAQTRPIARAQLSVIARDELTGRGVLQVTLYDAKNVRIQYDQAAVPRITPKQTAAFFDDAGGVAKETYDQGNARRGLAILADTFGLTGAVE